MSKANKLVNGDEITHEYVGAHNEFFSALNKCEKNGDCESSKEVESSLKRLAKAHTKIQKMRKERDLLDDTKNLEEVLKKHQQ